VDDASVADDCLLYRWLREQDVIWDANRNRQRPTSAAFQNTTDTDQMSIVLGDTLADLGRLPEALANPYLASLGAGYVRSIDQHVERDPLASEPAHGHVVGEKAESRRRRMAHTAVMVVAPPPSPPTPVI
jgi:hypothetical protein